MGGNNSRMINSTGGEVLPARIRPLLRQRIEEFRKRRNVRGENGNLSTKQLLKDHDNDNDNDVNSDQHSYDENEVLEEAQSSKEEQTSIRVVAVEKLSQVVPLPVSECKIEEELLKGDKDQGLVKDKDIKSNIAEVKNALSLHENKHEETNANNDDDEEEEEEDEDENCRLIGPGSPSFRIYCIEAEEKKEQELRDKNAGHEHPIEEEDENIGVHHKSHSTDSDESATSPSENTINSDEVVKTETTPEKKEPQKKKKLGAMKKNLFNVKNLQKKNKMNRMMACAGNNRRSHLEN